MVDEPSGWKNGRWQLTDAWARNVGEGSTSPLIIGDRLYVMGWFKDREVLRCLSVEDGSVVWSTSYSAPRYGRVSTGDKGIYSGISATPEFDATTGYLYTLGIDGDLNCWDTRRRGRKVWSLNLYDKYACKQRPDVGGKRGGNSRRDYGYTSSPLVHRQTLVVEVGSTKMGTVIGFHKRTGKQLWASDCRDEAGHSGGPVPITVEHVRCAAILTLRRLLVMRLDAPRAGQTVAEYPWTTHFANNIPTPTVSGQSVILTSAYNQYAMCRLDVSLNGLRKVWQVNNPSGVCSPIVHQGRIYWAWRGIHCVDFESGRELWRANKVGTAGSCVVTADDRLIILADRGELLLAETAGRSPTAYQELATRKRLFRRDVWPHVTLANGRLYCKDRDGNLHCFRVNQ